MNGVDIQRMHHHLCQAGMQGSVDHQDGTPPKPQEEPLKLDLLSLCVSSSAQLLVLVITPSGAQLEV